MTAIFAMVRKDLILYLNDKRALMLNLLMPIVLAAFFGSLFGGAGGGNNSKLEIGLVQQDSSVIGRKIGDALKADSTLQVTELSQQEAQDKVRAGKLMVAVVIPAGFGDAAGQSLFQPGSKPQLPLYYDPSQTTVLAMVKGLLTQHVMQGVTGEVMGGASGSKFTDASLKQLEEVPASDDKEALLGLLGGLKKYQEHEASKVESQRTVASGGGLTVPFTTREEALSSGPKYNAYAHAFAGMGVQFILFMGIDVGISILLARRMGIWNRLLAAPITMTQVLLSRALSGALIAAALMVAIFACAMLIFKVEITNVAGFALVVVAFALMTASFGLLIAAFGKTPEAARGLATFATLILVMLGGAWVPTFVFPGWMQQLTLVVPTRWAVDGLDAMTWRGLGMDVALQTAGVQLAFAVVFGALAIWRFRAQTR
ncbi:ABC transporter permease [Pseudoduganella sp. DS3]|uniref:ABC transporter permease n=1 Tax=Pseudoduganella guangdongensis TaxID=2692179 RepID=A0A6N9HMK0_9BURK|nr:ABC transporter permease [Pseudoduganella guangdongensis]MYN04609.1 ABC transporter permease [Pseudoduganella guangdongensis]